MSGRLAPADRLLLRTCLGPPGYTALLLAGVGTTAAASLLLPAALAAATNAVLAQHASWMTALPLAALLAAEAAGSAAAALGGAAVAADNERRLGHRLVRQTILLGLRGQRRFPAGDLTSRLLDSVPALAEVGPGAIGLAVSLVTALGAIIALWLTGWQLGLTFFVAAAVVVGLVRPSMSDASGVFLRYQQVQGRMAALLTEALGGIRTIQACGTADRETERVLRPLPALAAAGRETWRVQRRLAWRITLSLGLTELSVLVVAGLLVADGRLTAGGWVAVGGYTALALGAFESVDTLMELAQARGAAVRVSEVLTEHAPLLVPGPGLCAGGRARGELAFRDVTVRSAGHVLLDSVNLRVPAGTTVAIVGRSGAGKTTLTALPGRLAEPDSGEVLLDGVPVTVMSVTDLRRAVGYAFARPALLGATIAGHIGYGVPGLSRADVERAARVAWAHDFIQRLPLGYDTPLAQAPLSGGERQRLGLARAVAADTPVLVLDDATSSLDTATEARVNEALRAVRAGRTTLVVAHRVSTAVLADTVAWLDGGRVRACGPHAWLWEDPEYRAVFASAPAGHGRPSLQGTSPEDCSSGSTFAAEPEQAASLPGASR